MKIFVRILLVLLLLFPLCRLLFLRQSDSAPLRNVQQSTPSVQNLATLESEMKTHPDVDHIIAYALECIRQKVPGKCIRPLQNALKIAPADPVIYNDLAVAHTMLQQYAEGISAAETALKLKPDFALAKNNLDWATSERDAVQKEIRDYEESAAAGRNVASDLEQGLRYLRVGDYTTCINIWSAIVEKDPKNTTALNNIGTAFMMKHQVDDAIAVFRQVLITDPDNQLGKNNLAWALSEKDQQLPEKYGTGQH